MADLNMLMTETPQGRYPYAGIPWYSTTFGRDGLITALQMLWIDPRIAQGVLRRLAFFQAKTTDPLADAEPGKILHEMRGGEMAALREVPFAQYYGSVDSTSLFVLLAGLYVERTGDDETLAELWPAIEAALQWIDGPGDPDKDGFVEYQRATEQGLANQGWKDSFDAIFHADGQLAEGYIALAEVQGYVFAGKRLAARCARRLGLIDQAAQLESAALLLAERFEEAFWCEELGTYALALDGAKRQCKVRTSNAGQLLFPADCSVPSDVVLEYNGLDGQTRITALHFDPRPTRLAVNSATYHFELAPREVTALFVAVSCNKPIMQKPVPFFRGLLAHRREMRRSTAGAASIETSNNIFNEVLCQAMADLNMLMTETPQGRYPYAGIPWYSTTFGRDGLITALQMLWVDPRIAQGVLRRLAFFQAKAVDPLADAEPGKILHEMRGGEMAALREVPFAQYYGSVDSTPLFVLLAGLYVERTGDEETLAELWPAIEAALQWIDGPGDPDKDGFVEYQRATEQGLANQGWKDSFDAIFHADGQLAEGYIALAEVQGYVFAGKRLAARCARRLGLIEQAAQLESDGAAVWPSASRRRSGARNSAPTRWRSTAPSGRARCERRMPASFCSPASSEPIVPGGSRPI